MNITINLPTDTNLLKRRSSLFKPKFEEDEILNRDVDDFLTLNQEIHAPITWERLSSGYRIVDFEIGRIAEALNLLKIYYFCSNHTCATSSLYIDLHTIKSYQQFILEAVSDRNSFCAVEEGTGKLVGVAIASINTAFDDPMYEEAELMQKSDIFDMLKFERTLLNEANIHDTFDVEKYFCIHATCVRSDRYNQGIGSALIRACLSKAQKIGYSVCIGIFPAGPSQSIARKFDFEILAELPWINIKPSKSGRWLSYTNNAVIENSFVSCMGISIPLAENSASAPNKNISVNHQI